MSRHRGLRRAAVAGALIAAAGGACAQTMGQGFRDIGMKNEDWTAMLEAGTRLYDPVVMQPGAEAPWSAESGAQGVVRLLSTEPGEDGRPCVVLRYVAQPPDAEAVSTDSRRCRAESGRWLLAVRP